MTDRHQSASIASPSASDCLGRTCLKWGADGELTAFDLSLVLERLALVNPEVTSARLAELQPPGQGCPAPLSPAQAPDPE